MAKKEKGKKIKDVLEHEWTILCAASSVDEQSTLISLFNVIENINVQIGLDDKQQQIKKEKGWYAVPFNLQLNSKLLKKDIDLDLQFEFLYQIFDPKGKLIGKESKNTVKFAKGSDSLRLRNQIGDFPFTENGWYSIVLSVRSSKEAEYEKIGSTFFKADITFKEIK